MGHFSLASAMPCHEKSSVENQALEEDGNDKEELFSCASIPPYVSCACTCTAVFWFTVTEIILECTAGALP